MNATRMMLIALLTMSTNFVQGQDIDDGLTGTVTVRPGSWDLIAKRLFVRPRAQHATQPLILQDLNDNRKFPSLIANWADLKPRITTRRDRNGRLDDYQLGTELFSGWDLGVKGDGFRFHSTAGEQKKPLQTVLKDEPLVVVADYDVLMPASEADRQKMLKEHFEILEYRVTIHQVPDGDKDQYKAGREEVYDKPVADFKFAKEPGASGKKLPWRDAGANEWIPRVEGMYEIRFKVMVHGRLSGDTQLETQSFETSVRVLAVGQGLEIRKLSFEESKLPNKP